MSGRVCPWFLLGEAEAVPPLPIWPREVWCETSWKGCAAFEEGAGWLAGSSGGRCGVAQGRRIERTGISRKSHWANGYLEEVAVNGRLLIWTGNPVGNWHGWKWWQLECSVGSGEGGGGGGAVCSVGSGHGGGGGPRRAPQIGHVVPVGAEIMATLFTASQAFSSNIF